MRKILLLLLFITFYFSKADDSLDSINQNNGYKSYKVVGQGLATKEQIFNLIKDRNPYILDRKLLYIIRVYLKECEMENINYDLAIVQMCLETNFLQFTGSVPEDNNNYAGMGAVTSSSKGLFFSTIRDGVRAHVQHLKAYATTEMPINPIIDPRFNYVKRGTVEYVEDLAGRWAMDTTYGKKLIKYIKIIRSYKSDSYYGSLLN